MQSLFHISQTASHGWRYSSGWHGPKAVWFTFWHQKRWMKKHLTVYVLVCNYKIESNGKLCWKRLTTGWNLLPERYWRALSVRRGFCERLRDVSEVRSLMLLTPASVIPPPHSSNVCRFLKSATFQVQRIMRQRSSKSYALLRSSSKEKAVNKSKILQIVKMTHVWGTPCRDLWFLLQRDPESSDLSSLLYNR